MTMGISVASGVSLGDLQRLFDGQLENPCAILGPQRCLESPEGWSHVRTFLPDVQAAWLQHESDTIQIPMKKVHPAGLYEGLCPADWCMDERQTTSAYRIGYSKVPGEVKVTMDSYAVAPRATDFDQYLIGEGKHRRLYDVLGAHARTVGGMTGTNFAVWAPNARGISVIGDFNGWDYRRHPLKKMSGGAGLWEIFVPNVEPGSLYKFRVTGADGHVTDRTDPMGFSAEVPPRTASVVVDLDSYTWNDQEWLERRSSTNALHQPMSVYEVHLGSWQTDPSLPNGWLNYRELAHRLVKYCQEMHYTHLELLPVSEHPYTGSWGYQTTGYFSVTSRYGSPADFMYFVDYCHQHGIGVIIDWVPAHFPKDRHGLARFDGTALYEHLDPRQGEHPDWGTLIFNYGRNEVRNFLIANALFWLDKYHIDGLRVDAVASMLYLDYSRQANQWVPNRYGGRENLEAISFLREFNQVVHAEHPGVVTIAEESTAWEGVSRPVETGGLGFSLKWNMGWMNDTTRYFRHNPIHRKYHHNELTFSLIYAFHENFTLPLSHDEVVHGKRALLDQMPGDLWQKFANLRLLYTYMWLHPGKKLLFMGCDFGQWTEWNHNRELDWGLLRFETHGGLKQLVSDLNRLHVAEPALHELDFDSAGFQWIDCLNAENSLLAFLRRNKNGDQIILAAFNMTPVVRRDYRLGVDGPGVYREILNSDSKFYGGSNVGSFQSIAEPIPAQGRPWSIPLSLPPLAGVVLKQVVDEPRE
jgi:1,4-alpha-glucan branching enzyme